MFTTIEEAESYLYSFTNLEKTSDKQAYSTNYNLGNISQLLKLLGNPQDNTKIIHIAGTKGKGSTTSIITKLLRLSGYNVLTFLSPHLLCVNERFLFNEIQISDNNLIDITNDIKLLVDRSNIIPTTFELFFIIAILFGKRKEADYFVIETGLGGRLDATNVVNSMISVITPIGYDHTDILGKTIKEIAYEKAGIIKENSVTVIGKQYYNCYKVFKDRSAELNSLYYEAERMIKPYGIIPTKSGMKFNLKIEKRKIKKVSINLYGKHQINNFILALYTVSIVNPSIIEIIENNKDLTFDIMGRIQLLSKKPLIVLDVSHNKESAIELRKSLSLHFRKRKWNVLVGMSVDKDYKTFLNEILKISAKTIVTTPSSTKRSNPEEIYQYLSKKRKSNLTLISNIEEASNYALSLKKTPLLITG